MMINPLVVVIGIVALVILLVGLRGRRAAAEHSGERRRGGVGAVLVVFGAVMLGLLLVAPFAAHRSAVKEQEAAVEARQAALEERLNAEAQVYSRVDSVKVGRDGLAVSRAERSPEAVVIGKSPVMIPDAPDVPVGPEYYETRTYRVNRPAWLGAAAFVPMLVLACLFVDAGGHGRYAWLIRIGTSAGFAVLCGVLWGVGSRL